MWSGLIWNLVLTYMETLRLRFSSTDLFFSFLTESCRGAYFFFWVDALRLAGCRGGLREGDCMGGW